MSATGNDNDANSNEITFTIKDTELYMAVIKKHQKTIENYQSLLAKDLKDNFIGMNIKEKVRIEIWQMTIDIFLNQTL